MQGLPALFGESRPEHRTLYYGDCLDWMSRWDDRTVDLIYLDPPFNSKANYNVLYRDHGAGKAQYRAFDDTWTWGDKAESRLAIYEGAGARAARRTILGLRDILGPSGMLAYLTYMALRLEEMKRLLKPTGSIFLHCDPTASHYLKVLMDGIFGSGFRNEIVWCYKSRPQPKKHYGRKHDTILFYAGSTAAQFYWKAVARGLSETTVKKYRLVDADGRRYRLQGRGITDSPIKSAKDVSPQWEIDAPELVVRDYLDGKQGTTQEDWWADIPILNQNANERLGYPTQKPRSLLSRVIKGCSNEGDMILDPFCGCGTAVDVASRLHRRWAGIDISSFAIDLIRERRMEDPDIAVKGMPYDLRSAMKLAGDKPFEFESWAIMRMPGFVPNTVRVGDGGIDGRATLATKPADHASRLALAQVKGGKFNLGQLRDFIHVTDREKAALGVYVTLNPVTSKGARVEAARARTVTVGAQQYGRIQFWPVSDYFDRRLPNLPTMTDPYTGRVLQQGRCSADERETEEAEDLQEGSEGRLPGCDTGAGRASPAPIPS